jgi:hypothetical protein
LTYPTFNQVENDEPDGRKLNLVGTHIKFGTKAKSIRYIHNHRTKTSWKAKSNIFLTAMKKEMTK